MKSLAALIRLEIWLLLISLVSIVAYRIVTGKISKDPPVFPEIPVEILALLGISGGSYVVSKGIQTSRDIGLKSIPKDEERETVRPEKTVEKKDIGDR